jgi:hypothetical protein
VALKAGDVIQVSNVVLTVNNYCERRERPTQTFVNDVEHFAISAFRLIRNIGLGITRSVIPGTKQKQQQPSRHLNKRNIKQRINHYN